MASSSTLFSISLSVLVFGAVAISCDTATDEAPADDPVENTRGKSDGILIVGSCEGSAGELFCGGESDVGNCYCDDDCHMHGDCCEDKVDVCGGGPISDDDDDIEDPVVCPELEQASCEASDFCVWNVDQDGFPGPVSFCDYAEKQSWCAELSKIGCESHPDCMWVTDEDGFPGPISFCTDTTDEESPPECSALDVAGCDLSADCQWVEQDGFPGPIGICVDAGACETIDQLSCEVRSDCEWFVDEDGFPGPISMCTEA